MGKVWQPGKGSHYPGRCYVEYSGEFVADDAEDTARTIENILKKTVQTGGAITPTRVPASQAHKHSQYLPAAILKMYKNVHITKYPNDFAVCCGGTHLADVSQLGSVTITKIKKKSGVIRVSYEVQ